MTIDKFGRLLTTPAGKSSDEVSNKIKSLAVSALTLKERSGARKYDAMTNGIENVGDPENPQDVVTKKYLETRVPEKKLNKVKQDDGKYVDEWVYALGGARISGVLWPRGVLDAVSLEFVDRQALLKHHKTDTVDVANFRLTKVRTPTEGGDATNKTYVDAAVEKLAPKTYVDTAVEKLAPKTYVDAAVGKLAPKESVNQLKTDVQRLDANSLQMSNGKPNYDAEKKRIANLSDKVEHLADAVSWSALKGLFEQTINALLDRPSTGRRVDDILSGGKAELSVNSGGWCLEIRPQNRDRIYPFMMINALGHTSPDALSRHGRSKDL